MAAASDVPQRRRRRCLPARLCSRCRRSRRSHGGSPSAQAQPPLLLCASVNSHHRACCATADEPLSPSPSCQAHSFALGRRICLPRHSPHLRERREAAGESQGPGQRDELFGLQGPVGHRLVLCADDGGLEDDVDGSLPPLRPPNWTCVDVVRGWRSSGQGGAASPLVPPGAAGAGWLKPPAAPAAGLVTRRPATAGMAERGAAW